MRSAGFWAASVMLLAVFAALSAYALRQTLIGSGYGNLGAQVPFSSFLLGAPIMLPLVTLATAIVFVPLGLLMLKFPGRALWMSAAAGLFFQAPGVLAHSQLKWNRFAGLDLPLEAGASRTETIVLLTASIATLIIAARIVGQLRRQAKLESQGIGRIERASVLLGDVVVTWGLVVLSLVTTAIVMAVGEAIGGTGELFTMMPWTVLTVGGIATAFMVMFLLAWVHGQRQ